MSRIAVVTSSPPLSEGGHLVIARAIVDTLRRMGHEADLVTTPQNRFGRQAAAYLATWMTDVGVDGAGRRVDQVISLRFPSYAVRHAAHVCWLNHTMREYYDQWPRFRAALGRKAVVKETIRRRLIHAADRYLLTRNVDRLFVQSKTIQTRLAMLGRVRSTVLHPPPPPRLYRCEGYGDYIFAVSRLTPLKRLSLLIGALARPEAAGIRCLIAGDGEERQTLQHAIDTHGLTSRVRLIGHINEDQLVEHLARCRAVCFPPFDEDYGFVTVEAFACRKPVITCTDSGGPTELVIDGVSGRVCAPTLEALAVALREMMDNPAAVRRFGDAGYEQVSRMTWEGALKTLILV